LVAGIVTVAAVGEILTPVRRSVLEKTGQQHSFSSPRSFSPPPLHPSFILFPLSLRTSPPLTSSPSTLKPGGLLHPLLTGIMFWTATSSLSEHTDEERVEDGAKERRDTRKRETRMENVQRGEYVRSRRERFQGDNQLNMHTNYIQFFRLTSLPLYAICFGVSSLPLHPLRSRYFFVRLLQHRSERSIFEHCFKEVSDVLALRSSAVVAAGAAPGGKGGETSRERKTAHETKASEATCDER